MKIKLTILSLVCLVSCNNISNHSNNTSDNQDTEINYLSKTEYLDPKGFFSVFPPSGWTIKEFPDDTRGKVHFIKSEGNTLMILAKAIPQQSFNELYNYCMSEGRDKLINMGAQDLTIDTLKYGEYIVIERHFSTQGSKCYMIDYYIEGVDHNLFYSASNEEFDDNIKLIKSSVLSYNPKIKAVSEDDQKFHNIQSRRRVAKLLYDIGDYEQANIFVQDGIEISPNDSILLDIQRKIRLKLK